MAIATLIAATLLLFLAFTTVVLFIFTVNLAREVVQDLKSTDWVRPPAPVRTIFTDLWRLVRRAWRRTRQVLYL